MLIVVGSGVSGLSCALALLQAGYRVQVWARERPPNVTSSIAAALWYPYRAEPRDRMLEWARDGYRHFAELAARREAGVTMRPAFDLHREPGPRPWWAPAVPTLRQATRAELPEPFAYGWVFDAPVIDTRRYLPYLIAQIDAHGGSFVQREVRDLTQPLSSSSCVINCTGLGAATLCDDAQMFPIRGQIVHVTDPGLDRVLLDEHGERVTYVVPRGDDCVLGASSDEEDDDLEVRPEDSDEVVRRCVALAPALRGATRLADKVGLRPGRSAVRLEVERVRAGLIVHNYGHGGAGVTLSWGCANEVVRHVRKHIPA